MHIQVTHFDVCSFYLGFFLGIGAAAIGPFIVALRQYIDARRESP